jgi:hypothetical protein
MKRILAIAFLVSSYYAQGQITAEEIVSKHLDAIGGAEKWKNVNTMVMEGTLSAMGAEIGMKFIAEQNKGNKQEISFGGMTGYRFTTPDMGYSYLPFQGQSAPEPITGEEVKESIDDLDIQGNLVDYKAKGHSIEFLGTEDIEGTECFKLKVNRKNSGDKTMFIDKESFLLLRESQKRTANGQEMELIVDLGDYREVDGLKVPFTMSQPFGSIVFSSVKINAPIPEDSFAKPN